MSPGRPSVLSQEEYAHRLLTTLEADSRVSQRLLSKDLGIALGLTNLLVRRVVRRGWVRVVRTKPNRVRYLLTPAGIAEKVRMSRQALQNNLRFYAEARDRIAERLARISAEWPVEVDSDGGRQNKRIVFLGAGEVAEIGFICLRRTDLTLVAVVDDDVPEFFGVPVYPHDRLQPSVVGGMRYDRLLVMSFDKAEEIRLTLSATEIPADLVSWL